MRQYCYIILIVTINFLFTFSGTAQHLDFSGATDEVRVANSGTGILGDFSVPHDFTIEAVFYITGGNFTSDVNILGKSDISGGNKNGFIFELNNNQFNVGHYAGPSAQGIGPENELATPSHPGLGLNTTTAYHLAFVYQVSPLYIRYFVNGREYNYLPLGAYGLSSWAMAPSSSDFVIGEHDSNSESGAEVAFDYVRVWNVARTKAEIGANASIEVPCTSTGLLAQYKFDDGVAGANNSAISTVSNCVGGGYDGTLVNFAKTGSSSNFVNSPVLVTGMLPVELTKFTAQKVDKHINLNWQTASEKNNEGFDIERSVDGVNWERIDFVGGNGTTQEVQNYLYKDVNPLLGDNYYRLKQIDFNGQFEYSNVTYVATTEEAAERLKVYPTLAENEITIENGAGEVIIFNSVGQPIKQVILNDSIEQLNINDLPAGNYIIQIKRNGQTSTERFIKM